MHFHNLPVLFALLVTATLAAQKPVPAWMETRLALAGRFTAFEVVNDRLAVARNGRYGTFIDRSGRALATLPFSTYFPAAAGHGLVLWSEHSVGFASNDGRIVLPMEYDQVHAHWPSRLIAAQKGDRWLVFNERGRSVTVGQPLHAVVQLYGDTIVGMSARGFFGAWKAGGSTILPDTFHYLQRRAHGYWNAWRFGQVALLAPDGRPLTPHVFNDLVRLPDGRLLARLDRESPYFFVAPDGRHLSSLPVRCNAAGQGAWFYVQGDTAVLVDARGRARRIAGAPRGVETARLLLRGRVLCLSVGDNSGGSEYYLYRLADGRLAKQPFVQFVELENHLVGAYHGSTTLLDDRLKIVRQTPFQVELDSAQRWWRFSHHGYKESPDGGLVYTDGLVDSLLNIVVPARHDLLVSLGEGYYVAGDSAGASLYGPDGRARWTAGVAMNRWQGPGLQLLEHGAGGRRGLVDIGGTITVPARYQSVQVLAADRFLVYENGRLGLIDDRGQVILPTVYESITAVSASLLELSRDGRHGLATAAGVPVTPLDFDAIERNYPYVLVMRRQGRYGVYDRGGKQILPVEYDRFTRHGNNYIGRRNGRYGVFDVRFNAIAPADQDTAWAVGGKLHWRSNGVAHVWPPDTGAARLTPVTYRAWTRGDVEFHPSTMALNGKIGVYSPTKTEIWPPVYDQLTPIGWGAVTAAVRRDGRAQLLAADRRVLYEFEADTLLQSRFGYLAYTHAGQTWLLATEKTYPAIELPQPDGAYWALYDDLDVLTVRHQRGIRFYDRDLRPLAADMWTSGERCGRFPFFTVVNEHGHVGLLRRTATGMEAALPCEYEPREYAVLHDYFRLQRGDKAGLLDLRTGKLLPAIYDRIELADSGRVVQAMIDGKVHLFGPGFVPLGSGYFEHWQSIGDTLFIAGRGGRFGVLDARGKWVVAMEYDGIDQSGSDYPGYYLTLRRGDRVGGYRPGEKSVLPAQFDQVSFYKTNFLVNVGDQQALYAADGRELLAPGAWRISPPQYGSGGFYVEQDGKTGLVDHTGRFVIPVEYDAVYAVDGAVVVQLGERYGLFGPDGRAVLPLEYEVLEADTDGWPFFLAGRGGFLQYIDGRGQALSTPPIEVHSPFVGGLAAVRVGGRWGYLDTLGRLAIAPQFDYAENFAYDSRAVVLAGGRYQFIDRTGTLLGDYRVGGRFVDVHFQRQLHTVRDEAAGAYRVFNAYREELFNEWHALEDQPNNGLIACWTPLDDGTKAGPVGLLNLAGQMVVKPVFDDLSSKGFHTSHYAVARRNGKAGFVDRYGQVVIPFQFDRASPFCESGSCEDEQMTAVVFLNGKMFGINTKGECAWGCN